MLTLQNVGKTYPNGVHAVEGVSLDVQPGEIVTIVGGSGCGKSTLLRHMIGSLRPDEGSIKLFGEEITTMDEQELDGVRKRFGVLFQSGALLQSLTLAQNVALPIIQHSRLDANIVDLMVKMKLEMVGLTGFENLKPAEISGGMKKRVGLARALALDPELIFSDEPTAGLDPDRSESFVTLIQELRKELNLSVVMVTHDLDTLVALSDRVAVLCDQRLLAVGPLREITELDHPFLRNFFRGERGRRALEVLEDVQRLMPI